MGNILTAKVKIKGTRPLFWHHFGEDALPLEKQERTGVAGNDPVEWRKTVLATKDGQLYVEGSYLFSSMKEGARYTKKGRGSIQTSLVATLQVIDDRVLINRFFPGFPNGHAFDVLQVDEPPRDPDELVYLDVRGVRNPATKARNVRYRVAASTGWLAEFSILWDRTIVSRGEIEAVSIDAGRLAGIGSGRAIGLGRFSVEAFEVVDG